MTCPISMVAPCLEATATRTFIRWISVSVGVLR